MPEKSLLRLLTAIVLAVSGDLVMVGDVFLRTPWLSATAAAQESPIASPLAPPPAQVEAPVKVEVFPPGLNGVARYRIPGLVVTARGTLLAYCEARRNDSRDWGEIEIHLRRSTDGGRTWQPAQQIAHRGPRLEGNPTKAAAGAREQTVNNPVAIVDRQTGAIEFLYCVNYAHCFSQRSTDDGLTWSEPVEITDSFLPFRDQYPWKVIATGPGHGVQLKSGRLVVPIWLAYGKTGDHAPSASGTIYSDDHGRTWRAGEIAVANQAPYVDPNETMITVLSDDRVMLVNRNVSPENRKLVTYSRDGATGWSRPEFHEQLWEPICMASIVAHPARPGTLIFSNPHTLPTPRSSAKPARGASGKRENLTIKLSTDDGKTWKVSKTLEPGPSAYSDLAVLPDGDVLCLYERGNSITCARFSLDWINTPP
ncbi:MAG: exo-alpha-sialidase [Planctomycetota bacterium]